MEKPTVHYVRDSLQWAYNGVMLKPIDHTSPLVSNTRMARTSPVIAWDKETGRIETKNTIYIPEV